MKTRLLMVCAFALIAGLSKAQTYKITQLANGDVKYSVTYVAAQTQSQIFVRVNDIQVIATTMVLESGTTYTYTQAAATLASNNKITARFYGASSSGPTFIPGPTDQVWSTVFVYYISTGIWTPSSNNLFYDKGKVAIGTNLFGNEGLTVGTGALIAGGLNMRSGNITTAQNSSIVFGYNSNLQGNNSTNLFGIYSDKNSSSGSFIELFGSNAWQTGSRGNKKGELALGSYNTGFITFQNYDVLNKTWNESMGISPIGKVGIGISAPDALLHLHSSNKNTATLRLDGDGNGKIEMYESTGGEYGFYFLADHANDKLQIGSRFASNAGQQDNKIMTFKNAVDGVRIGIGTENPNAELSVNGKIEAKEIEVKEVGADYVFADSYQLANIEDVAAYVKANKHLPGIAPASETEKGVELGAFSEKLLEKVEELTLYVIQLNEKNAALQNQLLELQVK